MSFTISSAPCPRIAAAHGISVRHLYAVLARSGMCLGDHVRAQRLAECRRELAGPHGPGRWRTITAIGPGVQLVQLIVPAAQCDGKPY